MDDMNEKVKEMTTYTLDELREAFDLVADKSNWKLPIDAAVPDMTLGLAKRIRVAVIWFTGSVPKFRIAVKANGNTWTVRADGYYKAVGA